MSKTVFITGASSGIGQAIALEYAKGGARVAIAARRVDALEKTAASIEAAGGRSLVLPLDVTDTDAVFDAVRRTDRDLGPLDLVIANAGASQGGHSAKSKWSDVESVLNINVNGSFATLFAGMQVMVARKSGHLVGISSLAGKRALRGYGPYSASKAALSTYLETLRMDLRRFDIAVTDVQPGFVDTPMVPRDGTPLPFIWPVEKAAAYIVRKLELRPRRVAFPFPLAFATSLARVMPDGMYEFFIRRFL
ncbi:MAG: SDR family NAD(P)-dependent oxidoreductase [Polyangiaceae bacterium]|nr:SDR family NAD(P)-dependent oxidoreductase [Polyangiaceae bacterium]